MALDETAGRLVACGYQRVDQVEDRGQFAIRGVILDVYPATEERAVRCELFDVEVERLTFFSTFTQRSLEEAERIEIAPAAEIAPEHRELAEIAALEQDESQRPDVAQVLPVDRFCDFFSLVPGDAVVAVAAEEEIEPSLADYWQDVTMSFHDADAHHLYVAPDALRATLQERTSLSLSSISQDQPHEFRAQGADTSARSLKDAEPELEKLVRSGYRTVVAWARRGEAERAAYNLARLRAEFLDGRPAPREPSVTFAAASLREGFLAPGLKLAILPEHRLLRRRRAERQSRPATGAGAIASFTDLRAGSAVVHEDHGIARFTGFETKTVGGVTRDYLELEYKDGDRVFVPSDQLFKISRYVGADATDPPLSKLGGKQWEQQKLRARRAAQALAGELINLYAERKRRAGHAFPPDSEWLMDFERAFPFIETPDQLEAIEAVKADMEEARPMDRLICGDVGYGKTEVALRAAFKAATDGKQVMFLVPTTVLAQQHFGTFTERLRDYPLRIEMASRFRSAREVTAATRDFQRGKVDILIGTHRLLSRDVRPKDLGLLIVDEEQRFGVKQKDLLRQLRLRVDVLSLSATPIPRTLQMSLAGLRDISVIETPPEGRRPVRTYVGEYDEELVRGAIEREVERAYAYLFYPAAGALTEEAAARLATLSDYTELGSGFKIAMRDLEIRGAGNLLGEEQSGHVAAVGFELYVSMLDDAVAQLSGTSADEAPEPVRMDLPVSAYVPGDYVPYEAAKIEIHRRVAGAREIATLIVLREELEDRFGPIPEPLENLIKLQDARIKLGRAGAKDVGFSAGRLRVSPIELDSTGAKALRAEIPEAIYESGKSTVSVRVPDDPAARFPAVVAAAEAILKVASEPVQQN